MKICCGAPQERANAKDPLRASPLDKNYGQDANARAIREATKFKKLEKSRIGVKAGSFGKGEEEGIDAEAKAIKDAFDSDMKKSAMQLTPIRSSIVFLDDKNPSLFKCGDETIP